MDTDNFRRLDITAGKSASAPGGGATLAAGILPRGGGMFCLFSCWRRGCARASARGALESRARSSADVGVLLLALNGLWTAIAAYRSERACFGMLAWESDFSTPPGSRTAKVAQSLAE